MLGTPKKRPASSLALEETAADILLAASLADHLQVGDAQFTVFLFARCLLHLAFFLFASSGKFVGNRPASALRLSEEAVEFAAGGVERALFLFRAVVDERAAVLVDHVAEKSVSSHFP